MSESEPVENLFDDVPWTIHQLDALKQLLDNAAFFRKKAKDAYMWEEIPAGRTASKMADEALNTAEMILQGLPEGDRFIPLLEAYIEERQEADCYAKRVDI